VARSHPCTRGSRRPLPVPRDSQSRRSPMAKRASPSPCSKAYIGMSKLCKHDHHQSCTSLCMEQRNRDSVPSARLRWPTHPLFPQQLPLFQTIFPGSKERQRWLRQPGACRGACRPWWFGRSSLRRLAGPLPSCAVTAQKQGGKQFVQDVSEKASETPASTRA